MDTICAPATPPINSPLSIIRISGSGTLGAVNSIFDKPQKIKHRTAVYGTIFSGDEPIDDVVLIYYKSPESFTGEDMAEISCHGNPLIVRKIISLLNNRGIRIALPGEFSRRSFMNGKIDLTEAEAINHIITGRSDWEISSAVRQMHGSLKNTISTVRDSVIRLKADIESGIDFIEEDIEFVSYEEAIEEIDAIKGRVSDIHRRCRIGEKITHGIDIPIVGRPNVGKSSILNLILNRERAIVSDIPGTTRDTINEIVQIAGMPVNLIDTAGIVDTVCELERKGIEFTARQIEKASVVLFVIDAGSGLTDEDIKIYDIIKNNKKIILANKIDLLGDKNKFSKDKTCKDKTFKVLEEKLGRILPFSAKTGDGLALLESEIGDLLKNDFVDIDNSFVADTRIIDILQKALSHIEDIRRILLLKEGQEIVAFELQALIECLSGITGEITPDDILDSIFSRFCIGK